VKCEILWNFIFDEWFLKLMPWNPTFPKFCKKNIQIYGNVEKSITHANEGELYKTWKLEQNVIFQISEMRTSVTQVLMHYYIHALPMLLIFGAFRAISSNCLFLALIYLVHVLADTKLYFFQSLFFLTSDESKTLAITRSLRWQKPDPMIWSPFLIHQDF